MARLKLNKDTQKPTFIKQWRLHRNLTLERLAARLELTPGALSQLESGLVGYTQATLEALADALYCQPADLIMRPPGTTPEPQLVAEICELWVRIPQSDKDAAMRVLQSFARTGTNG